MAPDAVGELGLLGGCEIYLGQQDRLTMWSQQMTTIGISKEGLTTETAGQQERSSERKSHIWSSSTPF
jgi:hypothetical protein